MRMSDWSSDVCSSDLPVTGICTEKGGPDGPPFLCPALSYERCPPPVGASLLAMTAVHSTLVQAGPPLSRAGSLPHLPRAAFRIEPDVGQCPPLFEPAPNRPAHAIGRAHV